MQSRSDTDGQCRSVIDVVTPSLYLTRPATSCKLVNLGVRAVQMRRVALVDHPVLMTTRAAAFNTHCTLLVYWLWNHGEDVQQHGTYQKHARVSQQNPL